MGKLKVIFGLATLVSMLFANRGPEYVKIFIVCSILFGVFEAIDTFGEVKKARKEARKRRKK